MSLQSIHPATGETIHEYPQQSEPEVDEILRDTQHAFASWRSLNFGQRGDCFRTLARKLTEQQDDLARLIALEMGKPVTQAAGEIQKCAMVCEYYADHAATFLKPKDVDTDASRSYIAYSPIGVVLGIMPWNFPFWQTLRYAAPTMMAGNTTVLKHANNVTGCALALAKLFAQSGFPEHAFRTLIVEASRVEGIIKHPLIAGVTLTGSLHAGSAVGSQAGSVLKKSVLELGGSDPFLILEDADLDEAAKTGAYSRLIANGQTCIAAKRFIVPHSIREEFESRLVREMSNAVLGDPLEPETTLGPLARANLRESLHAQVTASVKAGARVLLGCEVPKGKGAYYPASVLTDVAPGMPAYDEEVFGPVAAIIPVKDEEEAIRVANDTEYGLGAVVFSRDVKRAETIARDKLEAGNCFVNTFVRSDPRLPFGGVKHSGYGRELGEFGIKEFVNIKTVYVK
jgi:succinate-semialdehyde dehydrogenase/glutarate-semialdehyde dehydrogenase